MGNPTSFKTPMHGRLFLALWILLALSPLDAIAQEAAATPTGMTEREAVERALAMAQAEPLWEARRRAIRAELDARTRPLLPTLGVAHEQVFGDINVGYVQETVSLGQELDWSGRRRVLRDSLVDREQVLEAERAIWQRELTHEVRVAFYAVRHHELRLQRYDHWLEQLARGGEVLEARVARGDASRYELLRMERELDVVRASRTGETAALARARSELSRWTGGGADSRDGVTAGALAPPVTDEGRPQAGGSIAHLPELALLEREARVMQSEIDALDRPLRRGWMLDAGYRYSRVGPSTGQGFLLELSLPLAPWRTALPLQESLRAEQVATSSEYRVREARHERALQAAAARLEETMRVLGELPDAARDGELTELSQAAFDAGEITLLELLDAFESEAELGLARHDLEWEARQAALSLDIYRQGGTTR